MTPAISPETQELLDEWETLKKQMEELRQEEELKQEEELLKARRRWKSKK